MKKELLIKFLKEIKDSNIISKISMLSLVNCDMND